MARKGKVRDSGVEVVNAGHPGDDPTGGTSESEEIGSEDEGRELGGTWLDESANNTTPGKGRLSAIGTLALADATTVEREINSLKRVNFDLRRRLETIAHHNAASNFKMATETPRKQAPLVSAGLLMSIPLFSGLESENVDEFLSQVTLAADLSDWEDKDRIACTKLRLRGAASSFVKEEPKLVNETVWGRFQQIFRERFERKRQLSDLMTTLQRVMQGPADSVAQFVTRLREIRRHIIETSEQTSENPLLDAQMLSQFQVGLYSDSVKQYVVWKQAKTLDEAQVHAEFQELQELGVLRTDRKDRKIHVIQGELGKEVAALKLEIAQLKQAAVGEPAERQPLEASYGRGHNRQFRDFGNR